MSINLINYALAKKDWEKAYEDLKVLEIGGRNLLRNTGVQFDWSVDSFGGSYFKWYNIVLFDDYKSLRGKTITLSFWAKTESLVYGTTNPWFGFEFRLDFADGTSFFVTLGGKTVPEGTNDWKKYSTTREIPDKEILSASDYKVLFRDATGNVSLKNIKLELGNRATDWTPAPEDINAHPFVAELAETVYRSKQNEERIRNLENALTALGGGS